MKKLLFLSLLLFLNYPNFAQKKRCENFNLFIQAISEDNSIGVFNEYGDGFRLCQGSNFKLTANFNTSEQKPEISYIWILPDGLEQNGETLLLKNLESKNIGEYTLKAKLSGTCLDTTVIVKEKIKIDLPKINLIDGKVCVGSDIQLLHVKNNNYPYDRYIDKSIVSFSWTGTNGFTSKDDKPIIKNVQEDGIYKATVSFSGLCSGSYELSSIVVVKNESYVETSSSNACLGGSITLKAFPSVSGASGKYTWKTPNGFIREGQEIVLENLASKDIGAYKVIAKYENGCTNVDSNYHILNLPDPFSSLSKVDEFCEGSSILLPRIGNLYSIYFDQTKVNREYKWTGPNNFESNLETPFISNFSKEKAGLYTLKVVFTGSCKTSQTITVNISPVDKPTLSLRSFFGPNELCKGAEAFIYSNFSTYISGVSTFSWTGPKNFTSSNSSFRIENFDESNVGNYVLTMNTKGCKEPVKAEINLKLASHRQVNITNYTYQNSYCTSSRVNYTSTCDIKSQDDKYFWEGPNGFKSEGKQLQIDNFSEKNEGIYSVTVNSTKCPNAVGFVSIKNIKSPSVNFPDSVSICEGGFKNITPVFVPNYYSYSYNYYAGGHLSEKNGTTTQYEWTGPDNFKSPDLTLNLRNFKSSQKGVYQFKAIFSGGCEGEVSKKVVVSQDNPKTDWSVEKLCNGNVLFNPTNNSQFEKNLVTHTIFDSKKNVVLNPLKADASETFTLTTVLSGACNYSSEKTVSVKDAKPLQLFLPEKVESCEGDYLSLNPSFNGGIISSYLNYADLGYSRSRLVLSWEKPDKTNISSYELSLKSLKKSDEGIYKLTGVLSGECIGTYTSETRLIVDTEKPKSVFETVVDKKVVSLKNNSIGRISNYLWTFSDIGVSNISLPEPLTIEKEGELLINLDVSNGCGTSTSSQSVSISNILVLSSEIPTLYSDFNVYPIPSHGIVTLENSNRKNLKGFILDSSGKIMKYFNFTHSEISKSIDLSGFSPNTYFIKTIDEEGQSDVKKILMVR